MSGDDADDDYKLHVSYSDFEERQVQRTVTCPGIRQNDVSASFDGG